MSLLEWLRSTSVSSAAVRAEIWSLGGRHMGQPLEGALQELAQPGLSSERTHLLQACVRHLRDQK